MKQTMLKIQKLQYQLNTLIDLEDKIRMELTSIYANNDINVIQSLQGEYKFTEEDEAIEELKEMIG